MPIYSCIDDYAIYLDIEEQLTYSDRYTIYLIYMLLRLRARYGDPRKHFTYQQLQGYYSKQRFKITPKDVDIPKWQSIDRSVRRLTHSIDPPLLEKDGRALFIPTPEFWIYVNERRRKNDGYFWRLNFEQNSKVSR